ncbi:MAG: helix-turn-helix domain-containing protein [Acidimicrobiales bacterium]
MPAVMKSDHEEEGAGETMTQVFALLGKRWNGLIIVTLLDGPARFSQIVRLVPGVSERMLSERLTELATAGLVKREVEEGPPVNVRYRLTKRGEALHPAFAELERWGNAQLLGSAATSREACG